MRCLQGRITSCLVSLSLFVSQLVHGSAPRATFIEHTIATDLKGGYQVVATDINHDGKPDLIALGSGMNELVWFENPGWRRHALVSNISRAINCAVWDTDGDGIPEIALAHEFANDPARSVGLVSLLKHKGDPTEPWEMTEIDRLSTSHRLRWMDIDGNGKKVLLNAPLAGAAARPPDYKGAVPLVFYRPGSWKREVISEELEGVLHGVFIADWDRDGREEILAASFLGIDLFSFGKNRRWRRTRLANGNPDLWPKSGSSEIAVGKVGKERFLCAIEPWHGNQVVVYRQEKQAWRRQVIDATLNDGHTLLTTDLNLDGRDEIIAGYRGQGRSVYIYSAEDSTTSRWSRQILDAGGIAAAGCAVADLNGDRRLDVAC
ncbi:MAG: VCBS repeat-containing protein, partial [Acidobacteria bacterium]|nr:VCBS repeat-containing protein [Acidobacteriota bacterium]